MIAGPILVLLAMLAGSLTLPPIDQCMGDASFTAFREQLRDVVQRRDRTALLAMLDDEVLVDLGGGQGKEAFAASWSLSEPERSDVWGELDKVLSLGCALSDEVRILPSMVTQLDPKTDAFETVVAIVPGAALRKIAREDAKIVGRLQWDVLTVLSWPDQDAFLKVRRGQEIGYVRRDQVRSPLDFRIGVERVNGRWLITTFVAGD